MIYRITGKGNKILERQGAQVTRTQHTSNALKVLEEEKSNKIEENR